MPVLQSSVNWLLDQAHQRLGNPYVFGGSYSATDIGQGCDCSGAVGWALEALVNGAADVTWDHPVSTESWGYNYTTNSPMPPGTVGPFGTIAVANLNDIPADAALTINIMHGGGGEYSHMNCVVPLPTTAAWVGTIIESNGDYGSCTNNSGAYPATANLWTDHYYLPGPWIFDVPPSTPEPENAHTYVHPGDSLSSIAKQFGVTLETLEAANPHITNPNLLYVGELVSIP